MSKVDRLGPEDKELCLCWWPNFTLPEQRPHQEIH
jgi:hypothetical protein